MIDTVADTPAHLEPAAGSSLYYSLLWVDSKTRQLILDALHLTDTLAGVLDDVQEPQVAEQKIHWWHEELARLEQSTPRHPATTACVDTLGKSAVANGWCLDVLSTNATRRFTPSSTEAAEKALVHRDIGARLCLLAQAIEGEPGDNTPLYLPSLTEGLWLHHQLRSMPRQLHQGHAMYSDERYQTAGVSPADLAARLQPGEPDADDTRVMSMLATLVDDATVALEAAFADKSLQARIRRGACNPLWRLIALRHRQLLLWQKHRPDLLRGTVTLTPFRKFLIARKHRG